MGCASSTLSFRETYAALQARWHLRSDSYSSVEEESVNERSRLFESCATERARNASRKLLFRGKRTFTCSPLLVEQHHLYNPPFAEEGKKNALHPYCAVVYMRLLGAVSAEHAYCIQKEEVVSSRVTHFLTRWDFRLWMVTCCEVFHVLAIFREAKALPKPVKSFMSSLPAQLKGFTHEADGMADGKEMQAHLGRVWKEGSAACITKEMLTPKVLDALRTQVPSALQGVAAQPTEDNAVVASELIRLAAEYGVRLEKVMNLHGSNPLYSGDGRATQASPSFLIFVEWVALRHALSVCGHEEDPQFYGVVQIEYSEKVLRHQNDAMQLWRARLHRLETVEQQLAELEPLGERSESFMGLLVEKKELEAETERLFAKWCGGHSSLSAGEAAEKCFDLLDIRLTLPDSSVHDVLSRKAYENSIAGAESGAIDTPERFRQYLKAYLALHDLYRDVLIHQLGVSQRNGTYDVSCMPDCVSFESFRAALWSSQMRHDIELDPLMAAVGDGKGILNADEVAEVFQQLFSMENTGEGGKRNAALSFDAVCTTVVEDLVPAGEIPVVRYPMETLGTAIGLTDTRCQARFIAALLNKVFTLSGNRLSNCGTPLVAEALEAVVELPRYTDYSAGVGMLATRFAYLKPTHWSVLAAKEATPSEAFVKWLHGIRSESTDRLSIGEHTSCDFFVRTLFSVAAAQRAFEDTMPDAVDVKPLEGANAAAGAGSAKAQKISTVTKPHFVRAVASMCKYLDCPADVLLRRCFALLNRTEGEDAGAVATGESDFTVEGAFRAFNQAYHLLDGATDPLTEGTENSALEQTISIQHVLFVVALNYTRLHCETYWKSGTIYDFYDEAAFSVNGEPIPKWAAEKQLLSLSSAMPLHCVNSTYREFADLTHVCAEDGNGSDDAGDAFQQRFFRAFYDHYRSHFDDLGLSESAVAEVERRAFDHITRNPSRAGGRIVFTRNDYSGFLQFVLGQLMMQKAYECTVQASATQVALAQSADEEVFLSERDLRRLLACFSRLTDGGARNVPAVEDARAWLQSHNLDSGSEGFFSLDQTFLWYGAHRVESYALESLFSWWKEKMASLIPFTVSTTHRFARLSAMREILRIKQHREELSEEEPVETAEDEDGYLPVGIIAHVMNRRGRLDEVTLRVFYMFEQENAASDDVELQSGEQRFKSPAWLKSCVRGVNTVVHRSDLESREVHHSDFRFLLQYVHHFVSAYVGLYYALTILEISPQGDPAENNEDLITGVSDKDRVRLANIFRESVLPLVLPAGTAPAEMTNVVDALLSKAWEEKRTKSVVTDSTCQEVAHGIAALFVGPAHEISARARQSYLDDRESQALQEAFTTDRAFIGALGGYGASAKLKYWERLRLLLPFGSSLRHRERRRELFLWMDRRQRGYLTLSDLTAGLRDLVQLHSFRADFTPALLRAFMATKEMFGEQDNIVYLTQKSEQQVLLPAELDAFLTYLYRYLELYFMFDVLTCGGHVNAESLHVVQKQQSYGANDDDFGSAPSSQRAGTVGIAADSVVSADRTSATTTATSAASPPPRSGAAALLDAAKKPYQITLEAAPMKKEITLSQFRMGCPLLRKWGAHVKNPDEVFREVNSRRRESEAMSFVGFAIWASEHELHPEGYGYGYDDAVDAIATMEEEYAAQ